jgi:hypothetical protein
MLRIWNLEIQARMSSRVTSTHSVLGSSIVVVSSIEAPAFDDEDGLYRNQTRHSTGDSSKDQTLARMVGPA